MSSEDSSSSDDSEFNPRLAYFPGAEIEDSSSTSSSSLELMEDDGGLDDDDDTSEESSDSLDDLEDRRKFCSNK